MKNKLFTIILLTFFLIVGNVSAQLDDEADLIATVNFNSAQIIQQEENNIGISFTISNGEKSQSNVKYSLELIDKEQSSVVDSMIYPEVINFFQNQVLSKKITYQAPHFLNGNYELWLNAVNSSGMLLALYKVGDINLLGSGQYVKIDNDSCFLKVRGEENSEKKYFLREGISLDTKEMLELHCNIENNFTESVEVYPGYRIYSRDILYGDELQKGVGEKIYLDSLEKKSIIFNVPKHEKPQAYDSELSLSKDGKVVSNSVIFHYIVSGESATIQDLVLDRDFYREGEIAKVSFYYTPSADCFNGSRTECSSRDSLSLDMRVLDRDGKVCSRLNKRLSLNERYINFDTLIAIECYDPVVSITLKNKDGEVLDNQDFNYTSSVVTLDEVSDKKEVWSVLSKYLYFLVFVLLVSFFFLRKKMKESLFLMLFSFVSLTIGVEVASADAFIVQAQDTGISYFHMGNGQIVNDSPARSCKRIGLIGGSSTTQLPTTTPLPIGGCTKETYTDHPYYPYIKAYAETEGSNFKSTVLASDTNNSDAVYTINISKTTLTPGESFSITSSAESSYCSNGWYFGSLVVWLNNIKTDLITSSVRAASRRTHNFTAPTTPGNHTLKFIGTAFLGHTLRWGSLSKKITVSSPLENGSCGTANGKTYADRARIYFPYTQCSSGSPSTTAFPLAGSSQTWTCSGSGGGSSSPPCSATRNAPCTVTIWSPLPSVKCAGVAFTQTSNCWTTKTTTGTKLCPTCSANFAPISIIVPPDTSTLTWSSANATDIKYTCTGPVADSEPYKSIPLKSSKVFSFVYGPTATESCIFTVKYEPNGETNTCTTNGGVGTGVVVTPAPPTCSLFSDKQLVLSGDPLNLTWLSTYAQTGSIDNGGGNANPVGGGTNTINPSVATTQDITYTGTFNGHGGTDTCPISPAVKVVADPPAFIPSTGTFRVLDTDTGSFPMAQWRAENVVSCDLSSSEGFSEIGVCSTPASCENMTGVNAYEITERALVDTEYTLTCYHALSAGHPTEPDLVITAFSDPTPGFTLSGDPLDVEIEFAGGGATTTPPIVLELVSQNGYREPVFLNIDFTNLPPPQGTTSHGYSLIPGDVSFVSDYSQKTPSLEIYAAYRFIGTKNVEVCDFSGTKCITIHILGERITPTWEPM